MRTTGARALGRAIRDEEGATATEYGLIVLMVSVAIIGALWVYGEALSSVYATESEAIDGVVATIN
jgi:pilus assembly protein Flp/PilA